VRVGFAQLLASYAGRRVLVTGHTGFKGAWLTLWLRQFGASVIGYSLEPATRPALFHVLGLDQDCEDHRGDIRDLAKLSDVVQRARPDYVFHLAAQPLVRASYEQPLDTLTTNVIGTANLLMVMREVKSPSAIVVVTSDKCYENTGSGRPLQEDAPMGGHDVYSMSKGAAELVVASFRRSFFPTSSLHQHGVTIGSARAGNVIGGGDWATDRIVPDAIRALSQGEAISVRNPAATRPWQHVLEPLGGYLLLAAHLREGSSDQRQRFCEGWNFGPEFEGSRTVADVVNSVIDCWGGGRWNRTSEPQAPHEAATLTLAIDKARTQLGWMPRWDFQETIRRTVAWYRLHRDGAGEAALRAFSEAQIADYMTAASTR
jgi:CDP-glucose 4,6-dehydratase